MSSRRLNFYLRHEAKIIDKDYHQPPYRKEDKPTPMYLMYFGNKVEHTIAHKIAKIVYPSFWYLNILLFLQKLKSELLYT